MHALNLLKHSCKIENVPTPKYFSLFANANVIPHRISIAVSLYEVYIVVFTFGLIFMKEEMRRR